MTEKSEVSPNSQKRVAIREQWERPEVSVLDIETGTLTVVGHVSDGGVGSTS